MESTSTGSVQVCVFCKIVNKEIPAKVEYEDEGILVFHDIHPKAPVHLLIISKEHIKEFADVSDMSVWARMGEVAKELIDKLSLREKGYRLVSNGSGAALIDHLHLHLLGEVEHTRDI